MELQKKSDEKWENFLLYLFSMCQCIFFFSFSVFFFARKSRNGTTLRIGQTPGSGTGVGGAIGFHLLCVCKFFPIFLLFFIFYFALRRSRFFTTNPDRKTVLAAKRCHLLFISGIHFREWISTLLTITLL